MLTYHRNQFFKKAGSLLQQDRLADEQLWRLQRMIRDLDSGAALSMLGAFVTKYNSDFQSSAHKTTAQIVSLEWACLVFSYCLALTYLRSIRGWAVRAMIANVLNPSTASDEVEALDIRLHGETSFYKARARAGT